MSIEFFLKGIGLEEPIQALPGYPVQPVKFDDD
jgi:hypothetical protein